MIREFLRKRWVGYSIALSVCWIVFHTYTNNGFADLGVFMDALKYDTEIHLGVIGSFIVCWGFFRDKK